MKSDLADVLSFFAEIDKFALKEGAVLKKVFLNIITKIFQFVKWNSGNLDAGSGSSNNQEKLRYRVREG